MDSKKVLFLCVPEAVKDTMYLAEKIGKHPVLFPANSEETGTGTGHGYLFVSASLNQVVVRALHSGIYRPSFAPDNTTAKIRVYFPGHECPH